MHALGEGLLTSSPTTASPSGNPSPLSLGTTVAAIVPTLFDSTSGDPAGELVQTSANSQGGNPMAAAFSDAGVRYTDGTLQLTSNDLRARA